MKDRRLRSSISCRISYVEKFTHTQDTCKTKTSFWLKFDYTPNPGGVSGSGLSQVRPGKTVPTQRPTRSDRVGKCFLWIVGLTEGRSRDTIRRMNLTRLQVLKSHIKYTPQNIRKSPVQILRHNTLPFFQFTRT